MYVNTVHHERHRIREKKKLWAKIFWNANELRISVRVVNWDRLKTHPEKVLTMNETKRMKAIRISVFKGCYKTKTMPTHNWNDMCRWKKGGTLKCFGLRMELRALQSVVHRNCAHRYTKEFRFCLLFACIYQKCKKNTYDKNDSLLIRRN